MIYELRVAVESLSQWTGGKAAILHGTNHSFCSGFDISSIRALSNPEVSNLINSHFAHNTPHMTTWLRKT